MTEYRLDMAKPLKAKLTSKKNMKGLPFQPHLLACFPEVSHYDQREMGRQKNFSDD